MPKIGETPKFRDLMERLKERRKDKQYRKRKKLKSMPFKNTLPSMEQRNKSAPVGWEIDPATDRLRKKK